MDGWTKGNEGKKEVGNGQTNREKEVREEEEGSRKGTKNRWTEQKD